MLLLPNKKKAATIIVGAVKQPDFVQKLGEESSMKAKYELPDDDESGEMEGMEAEGLGLEAAMEELLAAIEKKDAKALAEAFQSAMALCD